jgi:hypothetical protein
MSEDFSDYPKSVAEIRADQSEHAHDWTPRDVLIELLRAIDKKEIKPTALVVCYQQHPTKPGRTRVGYRVSAPDTVVTLGLLARISHEIQIDGAQ